MYVCMYTICAYIHIYVSLHLHALIDGVEPNKLVHVCGVINPGFSDFLSFQLRGWSYSNVLASTVWCGECNEIFREGSWV